MILLCDESQPIFSIQQHFPVRKGASKFLTGPLHSAILAERVWRVREVGNSRRLGCDLLKNVYGESPLCLSGIVDEDGNLLSEVLNTTTGPEFVCPYGDVLFNGQEAFMPVKILQRFIYALLVGGVLVGCTTSRSTNTARTAREQLLLSNAVDQSLSKIDMSVFNGNRIYIEEKYLECVDKGYVVGSLRHRAMMSGAKVVTKAEDADIVLELRSGAIGTDTADSFLGTPEIVLPGMLTLPEVRIVSRNNQSAMAKLGIVAYDAKTQQLLGSGGVSSSLSRDNNWYVLGIGPYQNGEIKKEIETTTVRQAGQTLQPVPTSVAFEPRVSEGDPGRLQLTGEEKEQP